MLSIEVHKEVVDLMHERKGKITAIRKQQINDQLKQIYDKQYEMFKNDCPKRQKVT